MARLDAKLVREKMTENLVGPSGACKLLPPDGHEKLFQKIMVFRTLRP
jgi:hypothetical protein